MNLMNIYDIFIWLLVLMNQRGNFRFVSNYFSWLIKQENNDDNIIKDVIVIFYYPYIYLFIWGKMDLNIQYILY